MNRLIRLITVLLCTATLIAQAPELPVLSETQKLQVQVRLKDFEIAQLKFEAAKADLVRALQALERAGYELDLQTLTYRKLPDPPKEPK